MQRVETYEKQFSPYTIGLHIRRTDNVTSITHSPTSLFMKACTTELVKRHDLKLFLATDSEEVKRQFIKTFGNRGITAPQEASRNNREGIINGLTDMWTLARTQKIYGSVGSTFSQMASYIGSKALIYIRQNE